MNDRFGWAHTNEKTWRFGETFPESSPFSGSELKRTFSTVTEKRGNQFSGRAFGEYVGEFSSLEKAKAAVETATRNRSCEITG